MIKRLLLLVCLSLAAVSAGFSMEGNSESQFGKNRVFTIYGGVLLGGVTMPAVGFSGEWFFIPYLTCLVNLELCTAENARYVAEGGVMIHPLGNKGWDPYFGVSISSVNSTNSPSYYDYPVSLGVNYWMNNGFGLKAQSKFYFINGFAPELDGGLFFAF